jgi:transcriptional regulator with XRE-family HTH domain/tetratricopeptide (TPR) repeat protein
MQSDDGAPQREAIPNQRLRRERNARNWSQEDLAAEVGTTSVSVSRWETGVTVPSKHFRAELCKVFGKSPEELGLLQAGADESDDETAVPHWFLHHPTTYPPQSSAPTAGSALPGYAAPGRVLAGRGELLGRLKEHLCVGQAPVALAGLPGVGKTALAAALIHDPDIQQRFPEGVLWGALGPQPNVMGLLGAWGAALGLLPTELARLRAPEDRARAVRSVIGARRMLVVADDAWDAESPLRLKVGGPACGYLVTTRFPAIAVRVAGDAFTLVPELSEEDGLALLAQLAPEVVRSEPDAARMLVRSVGGLPLALTLMGRFLRTQAYSGQPRRVHAALERLKKTTERLHLSETISPDERPPGLPPNLRLSLQAVIEVSEQLLDPASRAALRALALFPAKPNTFSEEAALAVTGAPPETLDALSDAGFIEGSEPGRYAVHRTIVDYARHAPVGEIPIERYVRYFVSYLETNAADYSALDRESRNILAALDIADARGIEWALVRGALSIVSYLKARGLYAVADPLLRRAEGIARAQGRGGVLARVLMHEGRVADLQGDRARADALYTEGLEVARASGDREAACALLGYWGEALLAQDDYARAEQYAREGLALARQLDQPHRVSTLLRLIGEIADARGEFATGEAAAREGLEAARAMGDRETASALLINLGTQAERCGDFARAEQHYTEGLELARALGHRQRVSALLMHAGVLACRREQYAEAVRLQQESLDLARAIGDQARISAVLQHLGTLAGREGRGAQAEAYLHESLEIARGAGLRWRASETLIAWGELLLRQRQADQARARFQEALAGALAIQRPELSAAARYGLARAAAAQGDGVTAYQEGEQSSRAYEQMGHARAREVARWLAVVSSTNARA